MADGLEKMRLEKIKPEKFGDFDRIEDEFLPFLHLNSEQVSELFNWKNKRTYRMIIDIRQDNQDVDKVTGRVSSGFKIVAYKALKKKSIDEMTDKEFEEHQGEELHKASMKTKTALSVNVEER